MRVRVAEEEKTPDARKRLSSREQASQDISEWMSGSGALVIGVVVVLLVAGARDWRSAQLTAPF